MLHVDIPGVRVVAAVALVTALLVAVVAATAAVTAVVVAVTAAVTAAVVAVTEAVTAAVVAATAAVTAAVVAVTAAVTAAVWGFMLCSDAHGWTMARLRRHIRLPLGSRQRMMAGLNGLWYHRRCRVALLLG